MSAPDNRNDAGAKPPRVLEVALDWNGKTYRITRKAVIKAFDRSGYGDFVGRHARFYLAIDGELKSAEAVFREIVPLEQDDVTPEVAELIEGILKALGFEMLDRQAHHE